VRRHEQDDMFNPNEFLNTHTLVVDDIDKEVFEGWIDLDLRDLPERLVLRLDKNTKQVEFNLAFRYESV
jgi:hypothetical protein